MGDRCTSCNGDMIADGDIWQDHCTRTNKALGAETYTSADHGALGYVAKVTHDGIVFDHAVVIEDTTCPYSGIWADDTASGKQTTSANDCSWVACCTGVNSGCCDHATLAPCGLQGMTGAFFAGLRRRSGAEPSRAGRGFC